MWYGSVRCWQNDYKIWAIILLAYLALYIPSLLLTPFIIVKTHKNYQYYAENCNYSIAFLERQIAENNNKKQKKFLKAVKASYEEIKNKILTR